MREEDVLALTQIAIDLAHDLSLMEQAERLYGEPFPEGCTVTEAGALCMERAQLGLNNLTSDKRDYTIEYKIVDEDRGSYRILAKAPCRFGVIFTNGVHMRSMLEKPEFWICSDGKNRIGLPDGTVIDNP